MKVVRIHRFDHFNTFASMFYVISFIVLAVAGLILILAPKNRKATGGANKPQEEYKEIPTECCGAHEVCEFDEYKINQEVIVYFDDEDLDVLRNVREDQLTSTQIDDLREVLYTLKTSEINKWLISLSRRHIHLPAILQQEARYLIAESQKTAGSHSGTKKDN